ERSGTHDLTTKRRRATDGAVLEIRAPLPRAIRSGKHTVQRAAQVSSGHLFAQATPRNVAKRVTSRGVSHSGLSGEALRESLSPVVPSSPPPIPTYLSPEPPREMEPRLPPPPVPVVPDIVAPDVALVRDSFGLEVVAELLG